MSRLNIILIFGRKESENKRNKNVRHSCSKHTYRHIWNMILITKLRNNTKLKVPGQRFLFCGRISQRFVNIKPSHDSLLCCEWNDGNRWRVKQSHGKDTNYIHMYLHQALGKPRIVFNAIIVKTRYSKLQAFKQVNCT